MTFRSGPTICDLRSHYPQHERPARKRGRPKEIEEETQANPVGARPIVSQLGTGNWELATSVTMSPMRWILWTFVALVGVVGAIALIGYFLPVGHEASRSADFNKPPEVVFALIADPNGYKGWWDGAEVKTAVVESVPPRKLVTKIVE